ncbi:E22 family MetX-like putative esterase [Herbaspirillum rhizosphaerae]|uniref:E22 family MetX-like putative esterase n=1 Tax=Herbaspirillum rhizosphaerae TaxID=346179 RepID=UPI00067AF1FB|nr:homoserine O-acetyltransferase [Herbaspirillum rhizosphaerae]
MMKLRRPSFILSFAVFFALPLAWSSPAALASSLPTPVRPQPLQQMPQPSSKQTPQLPQASPSAPLPLVNKQIFTLASYKTVGGQEIRDVRVGYETYGKLNEAGDNAVFIAHFYSGTSHAAGKYKESDAAPGYWDSIIGPGKAIDTDKYFVVSADTLVNINVKDPMVTTTGPASINPATGKPYGMHFPVVAMRDSVRVHKQLLDKLGVHQLAAAIGASGGSIQAMEWAALYPDFVKRVVHVIGPGFEISPYVIALLDVWSLPVRLDSKWKQGDYYGSGDPDDGVAEALKIVSVQTRHWEWAQATFGYALADPDKAPGAAVGNLFKIESALEAGARARAKTVDGNSIIYMSKANQLYRLSDEEVKGIKAKILFIPSSSDLVFPLKLSMEALQRFKKQGGQGMLYLLQGPGGHLEGVLNIDKAAGVISRFLATP